MKVILTFGSTHRVLKAESVLKDLEMPFTLDPAPKQLARFCDLVITVEEEAHAGVTQALTGAGVEPTAVYRKCDGEYIEV